MSKKRRRDQPAVDTQLVEIYEDLANVDENIRLKAAHALLTNFVREGKASGEQLHEILRRLLRGLCSGRKAARLGFSVALTELLIEILGPNGRKVPGFHDILGIIETLKKQTQVSGHVSGQEERDHQFGRLFGAESIIKSGILFEPSIAIEAWSNLLDIIYDLAKQKPWLREECGFVLSSSIQILRQKDSKFSQLLLDKLQLNGLSKTPEGIALWIAVQSKTPALDFPPNVWHRDDPLHRKEISKLAEILREGPIIDPALNGSDLKATQKGSWNTKLNFAWDVILAELLDVRPAKAKKGSKDRKRISFADFWEQCIENTLFGISSSEERKYWGFLLFQRVIHHAPENLIPGIFSKNLMRCLFNQLASPGRYLHRTADKSTKAILARARSDLNTRAPILRALLAQPNGDVSFDKITKTKTVETLLSFVDEPAYEQVMDIYEDLILQPGTEDEKSAISKRQAAADQLVSAVRSLQGLGSEDVAATSTCLSGIRNILDLLAKYAYFTVDQAPNNQVKKPKPSISQVSQEIFRSRLSSCLSSLMGKSIGKPSVLAYELARNIHHGKGRRVYGSPLLNVDTAVRNVLTEAQEVLKQVHAKCCTSNKEEQPFYDSLMLLYSLTFLQVYNESTEAVDILAELNEVYKPLLHGKRQPQGPAALVEVLLSFVAKPSQLFRRLAQQVFTACATNLDHTSLQSMIKVLETRENLSGQAEMFDHEGEDVDASSASDVGETGTADPERATKSTNRSSNSSSTSDNSDLEGSSDGTNGFNDADDDELAVFDAKLAQALGTHPGNLERNANDSRSSDEDMNDEEMFALDEPMAKVFREQKKVTSKKTEKKDARETMINFKCRVLELLEIYVKQQHANQLSLKILLPVLGLISTTTSPLVSNRAFGLIKEFSRLCKGNGMPKFEDADVVFDLLEAVHTEAMKGGSNAHASACSQASLLLVRILVARDREFLRRIVKMYGALQERALFDSGCKVKTSFFTDWLNWCSSARKLG